MTSAWLNISNSRPCAIATSVNSQAPAVLTASAVGAETAMSIAKQKPLGIDKHTARRREPSWCSPATGSVGYFFRSGLRGRVRQRRLSAGNSPIASTVSNAESNAPTRSCKPAIGERTVSAAGIATSFSPLKRRHCPSIRAYGRSPELPLQSPSSRRSSQCSAVRR
jgi:hypothetical protein